MSNAKALQAFLEEYLELSKEKKTLDYTRHMVHESANMGDQNTIGVYKDDDSGMWVFHIGDHHTIELQERFETAGEALEHGIKMLNLKVDLEFIEEFGHEFATATLA